LVGGDKEGVFMRTLVVALTFAAVCLAMPGRSAAAGLPEGSPCMFNSDCLSGKCRGGANKHCQGPALLPGGAPCKFNPQCASGKCRGGANKHCQGD
jgi:hypothetical protein